MSKFLRAVLLTGDVVVAEFSKLGGSGERYATQVMAGAKPFNAWQVVSGTHPASGEPVLVRTRRMISGRQVLSVQQVKPKAGFETTHAYDPMNFEAVTEVQNGPYGSWFAPRENTPEGATPGMKYPVHREADTLRRYVILKVEQAPTTVGGEPIPEVRHYVDAAATVSAPQPGDGDDDAAEDRNVSGTGPGDGDDDEIETEF